MFICEELYVKKLPLRSLKVLIAFTTFLVLQVPHFLFGEDFFAGETDRDIDLLFIGDLDRETDLLLGRTFFIGDLDRDTDLLLGRAFFAGETDRETDLRL